MCNVWAKIVGMCAAVASLFGLYTAFYGTYAGPIQKSVHLLLIIPLIFFYYPSGFFNKNTATERILNFILTLLCVGSILTYFFTWKKLFIKTPNFTEVIIGIVGILLVVEATRRSVGWTMSIIAIISLLYAYLGPYFPGFYLEHQGYSVTKIAQYIFYGNEGVFGPPLGVAATFVILFILFGAFLEKSNTSSFLMDLANAIAGKKTGGTAKVSVISSAFIGMISGSTAANVATTGSITIPMMKKSGIPPAKAGAIETVASTGGQILPPIMGVTVFVIMEFTGFSYLDICIAALTPALIYFAAVYLRIHLFCTEKGISGLPEEQVPKLGLLLVTGAYMLIPVFVLVIILSLRFTPLYAAAYSIVTLVIILIIANICSNFTSLRLPYNVSFKLSLLTDALILGARRAAPVSIICATAGIIAGVMHMTGLGLKISHIIGILSGGYVINALILTACVSLILGMGIPTIAAYIVVAVTTAPLLIDMGISVLGAHLFVFYFAALSHLTPPVAIGAYVAAGIAETSPMRTAWEAFQFGVVIYTIPFAWCFKPGLLLSGSYMGMMFDILETGVAVLSLCFALECFIFIKINRIKRLLLFAVAILLIYPSAVLSIISGLIFISIIIIEAVKYKHIPESERQSVQGVT